MRVDEGRVADPDAEQEPLVVGFAPAVPPRARFDRRVHPEVEDAGGNDGGCRRGQQEVEGREQVTSDIGDPQRREPELFELGGQLGDHHGIAVTQLVRPDSSAGTVRLTV